MINTREDPRGQVHPKKQKDWLGAGKKILSNISEKDEHFWVPEDHSAQGLKLKIFGAVFGPLEKVCRKFHMKPMQIFDTLFHVFDGETDIQTDTQTHTHRHSPSRSETGLPE